MLPIWLEHYNTIHPYKALGPLSPREFIAGSDNPSDPVQSFGVTTVQWCKRLQTKTWYVDDTYVKVRGKWIYLHRAIGDGGETLDFYLSQTRTTKAAEPFLGKALNRSPYHRPWVMSPDKNRAYNEAVASLRKEGRLPPTCQHRQAKFLNNRFESDHGKLK